MNQPEKKTPTVSVQSVHKPSNASQSDSSALAEITREKGQSATLPATAHLKDSSLASPFDAAGQVETVEPKVQNRGPGSLTRRNNATQDGERRRDKCGWVKATFLMIAETLSLGILSLPQAVSKLGLVWGTIFLVGIGLLTTATGWCYYLYKMRFPHVRSIPQALDNIFGAPGRWITDIIIMIFLILLMAGHLILFSAFAQAFSTKEDAPCRVAIMAIAGFINCIFTFYRKFARLGYVCTACCLSIVIATFVCLGFLAANQTENLAMPGNHSAFAFTPIGLVFGEHGEKTTIFSACSAFSNILLSYSGSICYLNIIDEMENPKDFWKCLTITNTATVTMYTTAGVGMYCLAGQTVASPALLSAGVQGSKISFGFGLPTILLAAVILANVQSKRTEDLIYAWYEKDADEQHRSQRKAFSRTNLIWYAIVVFWWSIAFIVANSLPWFGPLLSIIGAVSGNWICLGWPAMYMLHIWRPEISEEDGTMRKMTRKEIKESGGWRHHYTATRKLRIMVPLMILLIIFNIAASVVGLYGAILEFQKLGQGRQPFSCGYDWQ